MKNVYRKIKEIRELKGFKQDDLANHLGLVRSSYNKIENAKTALTIENLQKIADFLGVSVEEILFDKQSSQDNSEKDRRIRELERETELLSLKIKNLELKNQELVIILKGIGYSLQDVEDAKDRISDAFGNLIAKALERSPKVILKKGESETDFLDEFDNGIKIQ